MSVIALVAIISALSMPAGPPAHTGECTWVHGRYQVTNGSSVRRIWIIGTRRIVALRDDDMRMASAVARYDALNLSNGDDALFGDFHVCAREPNQPGRMQHVRITQTRRLRFHGKPF